MADASQTVPGDFNALYDDTTRVARGGAPPTLRAAQPAIARMTNEVPNISVHLDEATQNPVQVTVAQGPEVRGATRLSTRAAASPEAAARQFIEDRADLWQLNNDDIATVNVVSVSSTGLPTVRMLQKVDGVEVFQSDMTAAVGADNNVISVSGQLFHGAAGAPHRAEARAAAAPGAGTRELQAEEAIAKAASDLTGHPYKPTDFKPAKAPTDSGSYRFYACKWKVPLAKKEEAEEAQPNNARRLQHRRCSSGRFGSRTCCSRSAMASSSAAILSNSGSRDYPPFSYVVDAIDAPDILFRKNLTSPHRIQVPGAQYRRRAVPSGGRTRAGHAAPDRHAERLSGGDHSGETDRDRKPAARPALAAVKRHTDARQQLHRLRRSERHRCAGRQQCRRQGHRPAHLRLQIRSRQVRRPTPRTCRTASSACSFT